MYSNLPPLLSLNVHAHSPKMDLVYNCPQSCTARRVENNQVTISVMPVNPHSLSWDHVEPGDRAEGIIALPLPLKGTSKYIKID
jgi:hypothetical protein